MQEHSDMQLCVRGIQLGKACLSFITQGWKKGPHPARAKRLRRVCPAEIHPQHITSPSARRRGALADHSAIFAELSKTIFNFTYS